MASDITTHNFDVIVSNGQVFIFTNSWALIFKEISLNWRNFDLFKETFKEIEFLRNF